MGAEKAFEKDGRNRRRVLLRWAILVALIAVAIFSLASWIVWSSVGNAAGGHPRYATGATPEEAVRNVVLQTNETYADSFKHLHTREYDGYAVVLYELPSSPFDMTYYQMVKGYKDEWYIDNLSDGGGSSLVSLIIGGEHLAGTWQLTSEFVMMYGRTLKDGIASVEVDFHPSGQTIRADVRDGLIVIVSGDDTGPDAIRTLDDDGNVLAEHIMQRIN